MISYCLLFVFLILQYYFMLYHGLLCLLFMTFVGNDGKTIDIHSMKKIKKIYMCVYFCVYEITGGLVDK